MQKIFVLPDELEEIRNAMQEGYEVVKEISFIDGYYIVMDNCRVKYREAIVSQAIAAAGL